MGVGRVVGGVQAQPAVRACGSAGDRKKSPPLRLAQRISHLPERRERWEMEMVGGQVAGGGDNKIIIIKRERGRKTKRGASRGV